jgi:hypothetical protein
MSHLDSPAPRGGPVEAHLEVFEHALELPEVFLDRRDPLDDHAMAFVHRSLNLSTAGGTPGAAEARDAEPSVGLAAR